jgi:hypothetical protein
MPDPLIRILFATLFIIACIAVIHWLSVSFTFALENRLTQIMNEAVSGIG